MMLTSAIGMPDSIFKGGAILNIDVGGFRTWLKRDKSIGVSK